MLTRQVETAFGVAALKLFLSSTACTHHEKVDRDGIGGENRI
jgi:hypothetical protein